MEILSYEIIYVHIFLFEYSISKMKFLPLGTQTFY